MLLIRNHADHQTSWSAEKHQKFLNACEVYIGDLKKNGNLLNAQPMVREGTMIAGTKDAWNEKHYQKGKEIIVVYYHVLAKDLEEAVAIAKRNPEFDFSTTARVEVRPIKMKEETTGFVYPKK